MYWLHILASEVQEHLRQTTVTRYKAAIRSMSYFQNTKIVSHRIRFNGMFPFCLDNIGAYAALVLPACDLTTCRAVKLDTHGPCPRSVSTGRVHGPSPRLVNTGV